ncbi:MAG: HAMP domain-containing protein [Saprospiraceae bacterium]|jgi:signal transduction histidine kinase|nr:HAMP domain-containing protein [Saprospiraceae bacterium]
MTIKTKLALGLVLLFGLLLVVSILGMFSVYTLSGDSGAILKDNYQSLGYVQQMQSALGKPEFDPASAALFGHYLEQQRRNITEPGEGDATEQLVQDFERLRSNPGDSLARLRMHEQLLLISDLNLRAIDRKNALALRTAEQTYTALSIIATFCLIIGFVFLLNFPQYIADPIRRLTEGIREIAQGNYRQRIHLKRHDEFGELTAAFNALAAKLDAYEHSNLALLMFEKKRLETIIGAMHDPVIGLDEHQNVLFANEPARALLHLSADKLIGKDAREVALTNDLLRALLKHMTQPGVEPIKIFADGKESFFMLEALDIVAPSGADQEEKKAIGHVLILKNVTAFRERDLAKTNFIATISHELKTPISSIKMGLKLLRDTRVGTLNDEQQHLLYQLDDDAGRLLAITGELLKIAQAESGNIQLNIIPVAPKNIIETAQQVLFGLAKDKNVAIEISEIPEETLRVQADEDKSVWVLVNLLANAIRHSPSGKIVRMSAVVRQDRLRFAVRDEGPGIPEEFHSRIFDRFFQVPGSGSNGSGLGLAISREFVWAMGGEIGLESAPGKGSLFWFELPVVQGTEHVGGISYSKTS